MDRSTQKAMTVMMTRISTWIKSLFEASATVGTPEAVMALEQRVRGEGQAILESHQRHAHGDPGESLGQRSVGPTLETHGLNATIQSYTPVEDAGGSGSPLRWALGILARQAYGSCAGQGGFANHLPTDDP